MWTVLESEEMYFFFPRAQFASSLEKKINENEDNY